MPVTPPPPLVHRGFSPVGVARSEHVREPENFLQGRETILSSGSHLVIDFAEELVGELTLDVAVTGEANLELIYGEDLAEALLFQDPFPPEHWWHQPRDHLMLVPGSTTAKHPGRRAFRFVTLVAHGPGEIHLRGARMRLEHAEVKSAGSFRCSDPQLNSAWSISERTTRLCMQRFYEDGVKRDGMLWIGDFRVQALCGYYLFGDAQLARRSLEMFAECQHENGSLSAVALLAGGHNWPRIPFLGDLSKPGHLHVWVLDNYCADFVGAAWEYLLHTGDEEFVRSLRPTLDRVLAYLERVDVARSTSPHSYITDNQPDEKDWWGSRAALAFQLAAAFRAGTRLAEVFGDAAEAPRRRALAEERTRRARDDFGNPARALCRDDYSTASGRSWHAHAAAYLAGAMSAESLREVHPRLAAHPTTRRPLAGFQEFWMLDAWLDAGLANEALNEMRSYWGQMLRAGATTTWEIVDRRFPGIDPVVGRSHCHGWSAGPSYLLPARILGVRPTGPGFSEVEIRPQLGDLASATAEIPTPRGTIRVTCDASHHGEVTLPPATQATLVLPLGGRQILSPGKTCF